MVLCYTCEGITLDALCRGLHIPGYASIEASADRCPSCRIIFHTLSDDRRPAWWKAARDSSEVLKLQASKELPFALSRQDEVPVAAKSGRGIIRLDIVYGYRVLGALSVFAAQDDPLAVSKDILARPLMRNVDAFPTFELIQTWIHDCNTNHRLCQYLRNGSGHSFTKSQPPRMPSRVLDLCLDDGSDDVRLIETAHSRGLYAALSHFWGKSPIIRTLKSNLSAMQGRIEFSKLSKTFQDAAVISRRLKLQFLWIDSLCIVQDDAVDWEREAAMMGSVYRNSYLTIAAAGAKDGSEGCFIPRPKPLVDPLRSKQTSSRGEEGSMWIGLYHGDFVSSVTTGPLNTRGWVLQERALASRTVHFAEEQIYWECDQVTLSEDGRTEFHSDSLRHILSPLPSLHLQYLTLKLSPTEFLYDRWYSLVENYTSRKLTKQRDIFPALSGLASEVAKLANDEYVAGLWKNCFHVGLLWKAKGIDWSPLSRPKTKRAPSWSWAAVEGPVSYLSSSRVSHTKEDFSSITIHDVDCVSAGENPYGQVGAAVVRLTGSLKKAFLDEGDQPQIPGLEIQSKKGQLAGTGYLDAECEPPEHLSVLKVCRSSAKDEPGLFWFVLLLKEAEGGSGRYERAGMGMVTEFGWFDDSLEETISLV